MSTPQNKNKPVYDFRRRKKVFWSCLFKITRSLAWENINIVEIISVDVEVTFIIQKKDANKGYNALERLVQYSK